MERIVAKTLMRYAQINDSKNQIFGDKDIRVQNRRKLAINNERVHFELLFKIKLGDFVKDYKDENQLEAMEEKLNQIDKNDTWELVPRPKDKNAIGTKWLFRHKFNEDVKVIRIKNMLVCKSYVQVEGIDCEETFVLVAKLEEVGKFLALSIFKNLKLYQKDVKSIFLNDELEEVYNE